MLFPDCGMAASASIADMACNPVPTIKAFNGAVCIANFKLLFHKSVWNGVIVPLYFNMVVEVDHGFFPVGQLIWGGRQCF